MPDSKTVLQIIKDNDASYVDFRFTDLRGRWQHITQHVSRIDEERLERGIVFDGSSVAGWKGVEESDMILRPDLSTAIMDPFAAQPQLILTCDVIDPITGEAYNRDPRSTARKASQYLRTTEIAESLLIGPEAEFFVFDDIRFAATPNHTFVQFESEEGAYMSGAQMADGNLGHRPGSRGGAFALPPVDAGTDLRAEMLSILKQMGVEVEKHHHEVGASQHELGIRFDTLLRCADNMQILKFVVLNVAHSYGKTATFMPRPVFGDSGSGMHLHQSLWKDRKPLFEGDGYAGLSESGLHYIGGILKHARALNAFTNPSTNSYRRLVPGGAPLLLAYSACNRSAACRIPHSTRPDAKRIEVRFPDSIANPYLAFAAILMAGLDGIENRIDPGEAADRNLHALSPEEAKDQPRVCRSLREALEALEGDQDFLLAGNVFDRDQIEAYLKLKWSEVHALERCPHPIEFQMYYSG